MTQQRTYNIVHTTNAGRKRKGVHGENKETEEREGYLKLSRLNSLSLLRFNSVGGKSIDVVAISVLSLVLVVKEKQPVD